MLPDRSKRYASADGEIPRQKLTSTWQLLLVVLVVLTLYYLVFPQKVLMQRLYELGRLDTLALSYLQNMYRADTRNADAALLLARHRADSMDARELEDMVLPYSRSADQRRRAMAHQLLVIAYERQLSGSPTPVVMARLRERLADVIRQALNDPLPKSLAQSFATLAYRVNLPELGARMLQTYASTLTLAELEQLGHEALGRRDYVRASYYFLLARERSTELTQTRRFFQLGINALMAGGLYAQALETAEARLGHLDTDLPTLRYLIRMALAAGQPALAARYARQLVFHQPGGDRRVR
ncbi:MAG: hypothetical protein U1E04_13550 [Hylemonella sp.]|nr:hypothetical protein [Hylemonella sp.]